VQIPPWGKKPAIFSDPCKETSIGAVHKSEVYSAGVGLKGPTLLRLPIIKKINKK
jgi:hypothetical protein